MGDWLTGVVENLGGVFFFFGGDTCDGVFFFISSLWEYCISKRTFFLSFFRVGGGEGGGSSDWV